MLLVTSSESKQLYSRRPNRLPGALLAIRLRDQSRRSSSLRLLCLALPLAIGCLLSAGCVNDKIHPTNGGLAENGVLSDGPVSGVFQNDSKLTGPAGTDISTLNFDGAGEVIAYTNERPPTLLANIAWTAGTDTVNLNFENLYQIPVSVWIVQGPFANQQNRAASANVKTSQIWADERQGISFSVFNIVDATANVNAPNFYAFSCALAANMKAQIGFTANEINIYYVDTVNFGGGPATTNGVSCGGGVIAMGSNTSNHLLAHEMGHKFNLLHVNALNLFFDTTNVMHNASNNRNYLTEGQTFRTVVNSNSVINNTYNARPGLTTRSCLNDTSGAVPDCPAVQKRIWADGVAWPPN